MHSIGRAVETHSAGRSSRFVPVARTPLRHAPTGDAAFPNAVPSRTAIAGSSGFFTCFSSSARAARPAQPYGQADIHGSPDADDPARWDTSARRHGMDTARKGTTSLNRGRARRAIALAAGTMLLMMSLGAGSALAAVGPEHRNAENTFTKWISAYPAMTGFVGGDVGSGSYAGEILSLDVTGTGLVIDAAYHFSGSRHSFTALVHVVQTGFADGSGAVITGAVTEGWLRGNPVQGSTRTCALCAGSSVTVRRRSRRSEVSVTGITRPRDPFHGTGSSFRLARDRPNGRRARSEIARVSCHSTASCADSSPRRWPSSRRPPAPPAQTMPRGSRRGPPGCRRGCRRCPPVVGLETVPRQPGMAPGGPEDRCTEEDARRS